MKETPLSGRKSRRKALWTRSLEFLRPHWRMAVLALIAAVAVTSLEMVPPLLLRWLIDDLLPSARLEKLLLFVGVYCGAAALIALLSIFRGYFTHSLGATITFDIRNTVHDQLQKLPISFYENERTGDLLSRTVNDVEQFEDMITHGARDYFISILTLIGVTGIIFWSSWQLALAALIPVPLIAWLTPKFSRQVRSRYKKVREATGAVSALLQDNISGIRVTRAFGREATERERFRDQAEGCRKAQVEAIKSWTFYIPLVDFITYAGVALVMASGAWLAYKGTITTGVLAACYAYMIRFYDPIRRLNMNNNIIQRGLAGAERVFELLDQAPEAPDTPTARALDRARGRIEFENVSFSYPGSAAALHGINLTVEEGETLAVVGHTGAGKSTLLSLIPRFYSASEGAVRIDGVSVGDIHLSSLRRQIGIVFQEPFLFNGTVRENIAYGKKNGSEEELFAAARAAHAHDFIVKLPFGYDTLVGERGVKLSGGERQRITIARTLLKDPPILMLDEATSAVDAESEELIQDALETLMRGRTTLIVAHRLSTIRKADRAVVIEKGRIVETGTHESLFSENTLYRQLYARQLV